jgi:hypothetical protein
MKKLFSALLILSIVFSCSKNNEQNLGGANTCNSTNMTFTTDIKPILQNNCFSCHGNGLSQNGINFDTYAGVKAVADNGKLVGAITHAAGFLPMPQSAPKLSDCNINKIKDWVNRGALNN